MTIFLLFARTRIVKSIQLIGVKIGERNHLSARKKRAQNVVLTYRKFFVCQFAKKMEVSKATVYNAIMRYQNEDIFKDKNGLADQRFPAAEKIALCKK